MTNKKAAIYARVSSRKQKEEETIASQINALSLFASKQGYTVPQEWIFEDNGVSGSTLQRDGLDELRDLVRAEPLGAVLVYAPDRLSRSYPQQLLLLEEFKKNGVTTQFIKSPHESNTPEGVMFQHFQGIFAEYERALILDRSRRGRIFKAKQGDPSIIPSLPFGYRKEKEGGKTVVKVTEQEAVIVREIYKLYTYEELPLTKISQELTAKGIRSPKGLERWDLATLRGILKNPTYTGTSYFGKTESYEGVPDRITHHKSGKHTNPKHARRARSEADWIPINVPTIIGENDFEQAQEQIKKNVALASRNTKTPTLLQGLVICGRCGYPYYKRKKTSSRSYYHCRTHTHKHMKKCNNKSVRQEKLDGVVFKEVLYLLRDPVLVKQEIQRRAKEASNTVELEKQEKSLKSDMRKLQTERDRLLDAYQSGLMNLHELSTRNKEMDERRNKLENQLKGVQALKLEGNKSFDIKKTFNQIMKRFEKVSGELSFDDKRKLIRLLVDKVVVEIEKITIHFTVSPRVIAREMGQLESDGHCQAFGPFRPDPCLKCIANILS